MTVVAWDGEILAADKQATYGNLRRTSTKIYLLDTGEIIAFCGTIGTSDRLLDWYKSGADKDSWPYDLQKSDDWSNIIIADRNGVRFSDQQPYFKNVEDKIMAWGTGADFAIGAMEMGASAIKAVEIASKWSEGCGMGIDYYEVSKCHLKKVQAKK